MILIFHLKKSFLKKLYVKKSNKRFRKSKSALQNVKTSLNELEDLFDQKSFQERKIFLGKITDFKKFPKELVLVETRSNNITKDMVAFNAFGLIGVIDELLNNSIKINLFTMHQLKFRQRTLGP